MRPVSRLPPAPQPAGQEAVKARRNLLTNRYAPYKNQPFASNSVDTHGGTVKRKLIHNSLRLAICGLLLSIRAYPALAQEADSPAFSWPIGCVPGFSCVGRHFRIGYPDVGGTGASFNCGEPGYTGHQGTDIIISAVEQGVPVLAAADGIVRWTKDGMYDRCPDATRPECEESLKSRLPTNGGVNASLGFNAGNFIVIEHDSGTARYLTLYAHLRSGSLRAAAGQRVTRGERIADVGSSGNSQIPHLHFGVYRQDGGFYLPVDPWEGPCNTTTAGLWASDPPFQPSSEGILARRQGTPPSSATSTP